MTHPNMRGDAVGALLDSSALDAPHGGLVVLVMIQPSEEEAVLRACPPLTSPFVAAPELNRGLLARSQA